MRVCVCVCARVYSNISRSMCMPHSLLRYYPPTPQLFLQKFGNDSETRWYLLLVMLAMLVERVLLAIQSSLRTSRT